jgi:hypothetical protein
MRNKDSAPPTAKELAFFNETGRMLLSVALGDALLDEYLKLFNPDGLLRARQTTMLSAEALARRAPPFDEAKFLTVVDTRMEKFNDIWRRIQVNHPVLRHPTAKALTRFLGRSPSIPPSRLRELIDDGTIRVLVAADEIPRMVRRTSNLFEPTVEEAGRYVQAAIEHWYKDLIIELVSVTCARSGTRRSGRNRQTLGAWMREARTLWNRKGPAVLLDGDLCNVRNVLAHEGLRVNVRDETVTSPLDGAPLDREAFALFCEHAFGKLLPMVLALVDCRRQETEIGNA